MLLKALLAFKILAPSLSRLDSFRGIVSVSAMERPGVLQLRPYFPSIQKHIEANYTHLPFWKQSDKMAFLDEHGSSVRGLVSSTSARVDEDLLSKLPNLEIVSCFSVGTDSVDLIACKKRNVIVTNTPDVLTDCTADTALALMLSTMRLTVHADRFVREGHWPTQGQYRLGHKVSGKRVGIVGLGRIGQAIGRRVEGFGCPVSYYSRSERKEVPYTYYSSVLELASNSDILVIAIALTKETTHIVNRDVLNALGPRGHLINIARGPVVDEGELVKALVEGRILGAGLDVFEDEPNVPKELHNLDNVVLQPHLGSGTWETRSAMADLVLQNLDAHFSGQPVLTPVS